MADEDVADLSARASRSEAARRRSRTVVLQGHLIMWLGVASTVAGIGVLVAVGDKLIAGGMTFGGAGLVMIGLLRGAYGHYLYWRMSTG
jgi:hypothetical protein